MATYKIDQAHSEVTFKIKHLMITNVTGSFTKFDGSVVTLTDDFDGAQVDFEAGINSITTSNEQRDGHLKSADFFDAEKFPKLTFKSTGFSRVNNEGYKLTGNLTIRDVTKPVTLDVEFGGNAKDMYGQEKAGFEITGKINRKDFGLTWNAAVETGGVVLSEDVKLNLNVQVVKQA